MENAQIAGNVILGDGFVSQGKVSLQGADVGSVVYCKNGRIEKSGMALVLDAAKIKSHILLSEGFECLGIVSLGTGAVSFTVSCR